MERIFVLVTHYDGYGRFPHRIWLNIDKISCFDAEANEHGVHKFTVDGYHEIWLNSSDAQKVIRFLNCGSDEQSSNATAAPTASPYSAAPSVSAVSARVKLRDGGMHHLNVINVIRKHTGWGLGQAKDVVDNAPTVIDMSFTKEQATAFARDLEANGAIAAVLS